MPSQALVILSNRQGPAYFLVPVQPGDLEAQGRERLRAQAKASLRAWQLRAKALGMDKLTDVEIDAEIPHLFPASASALGSIARPRAIQGRLGPGARRTAPA